MTNSSIDGGIQAEDTTTICSPLIDWSLFYVPIAVFSLAGHSVIARTVYKHRRQLHHTPFILLINLGLSDTLFSSSMSLGVIVVASARLCEVLSALQVVIRVAFISSLFSSVGLAVDRFVAIRYCLFYTRILNNTVTYRCCGTIWLVSIVLCLLMTINDGFQSFHGMKMQKGYNYLVTTLMVACSVFIVTCLCYVHHISRTLLAHMQRITKHLHGVEAEQYFMLKKRRKMNQDVMIISTISVVALLPVISVYLKIVIHYTQSDMKLLFGAWAMALLYTALNPFIYIHSMRTLKSCLMKDIKSWRQKCLANKLDR